MKGRAFLLQEMENEINMEKERGFYWRIREGGRVRLFSVQKWALKTRVQKPRRHKLELQESKSHRKMNRQKLKGRGQQILHTAKIRSGCEIFSTVKIPSGCKIS